MMQIIWVIQKKMFKPETNRPILPLGVTEYRPEGYGWRLCPGDKMYHSLCDPWQHLCRYHLEGVQYLLMNDTLNLLKAATCFSFIENFILPKWNNGCMLFIDPSEPSSEKTISCLKPSRWKQFKLYALCLIQQNMILKITKSINETPCRKISENITSDEMSDSESDDDEYADYINISSIAMTGYIWSTRALSGPTTPREEITGLLEEIRTIFFAYIAYSWCARNMDDIETIGVRLSVCNLNPPHPIFETHRKQTQTHNDVLHAQSDPRTWSELQHLFSQDIKPFIHESTFTSKNSIPIYAPPNTYQLPPEPAEI